MNWGEIAHEYQEIGERIAAIQDGLSSCGSRKHEPQYMEAVVRMLAQESDQDGRELEAGRPKALQPGAEMTAG